MKSINNIYKKKLHVVYMDLLKVKPIVNKNNGQINFSLSKKKIGKELTDLIKNNPKVKIKFKFEGMDF